MRSQHAPQKRRSLLSILPRASIRLRVLAVVAVLGLLFVSLCFALLRTRVLVSTYAPPAVVPDGETESSVTLPQYHAPSDSPSPVPKAFSPPVGQLTALQLFRGNHIWNVGGDRYLLAVCLRGQLHNRLGCLYRHLVLASLLNRTLIVPLLPSPVPLDLCSVNVDKDSCPRYHLHLAWDLARARACLGTHSVLSTDEYAQRHRNKPLVVRRVHCWSGPLGMCKPRWQPKAVIGKNCLGTAVVRNSRRLRFMTRPVKGKGLERWAGVRWPKGKEAWRLQLLNEEGKVVVKEKAGVRFACLPRFSNHSQVMEAYGGVRDKVLVVGDLVGTAVKDLWPASHMLVQALGGGGGGGGDEEIERHGQVTVSNNQNGTPEGSQEDQAPSNNGSTTSSMLSNSKGSIAVTNETFSEAATRFLASQPARYTNPLLGTLEDWTSMLAPLSPLYPSAPIAPHALVFARARAVISFLFSAAQGDEGHRHFVRSLYNDKNHADFWRQVSNHSGSTDSSSSTDSRSSSSRSSSSSSGGGSGEQGNRFLAIHWRRGDWWMYCAVAGPPGACNFEPAQAAYCVVKVARKHNLTNIFLATNAKQSEVERFSSALGPSYMVARLPPILPTGKDPLLKGIPPDERTEVAGMVGLLLDKVIAAHAAVFLRTRGSSLSKDVLRLRLGVAHYSSPSNNVHWLSAEERAVAGNLPAFSAMPNIYTGHGNGFVDDVLCDGQKEWNPMEGLSPFFRATKLNRMRRALPAEWPL